MAATCAHSGCPESPLSFVEHCWAHTKQDAYSKLIPQKLRELNEREAFALNFKKAALDGVDFSRLNLTATSFSQARLFDCHFIGAILCDADFIGARLDTCDFVGADVRRANFTRAIVRAASFSYADLREANFTEAVFREGDFTGASLFGSSIWNAELAGARHLSKKNFRDPSHRGPVGRFSLSEKIAPAARDSYRILKHHFGHHGLYEDARWAAYREMLMEREHYRQTRDPRWVPSFLMDATCGYTEKPNRVILFSFAIVLFYALAYWLTDAIWQGAAAFHRATFWDSLYFSFITFTTVGYGDWTPRAWIGYRLLACAEAFSGPFMAGLYVFTLTRRYAAG